MIFKCLICDQEVEIKKPYTQRLERTTRLVSSNIGSKVMLVRGLVHCPSCDDTRRAVLSPVKWVDLLLEDLMDSILVIKSRTNVSLHPASSVDFAKPPIYQLDEIEIAEFVKYGKITFTQELSTDNGSNHVGHVSFEHGLEGTYSVGSGNQLDQSVTINGQKIRLAVIGNGITFYN